MRRWVDRFSVNTEPCLGLGLLEAAVPFSALITAAWRAMAADWKRWMARDVGGFGEASGGS
jgi:hypothetical protein